MTFWAYMLRCVDGSYYVGHTDDLDRRLAEHNNGVFDGYTQTRRPVALVWSQDFATRDEAFAAERQIKGWSRRKKEALIAGDWELVSRLALRRRPQPERALETGVSALREPQGERVHLPQRQREPNG